MSKSAWQMQHLETNCFLCYSIRCTLCIIIVFFYYEGKFPSNLIKITYCIMKLLYKRFILDDDFLTLIRRVKAVEWDAIAMHRGRVDARAIYTRGFARARRDAETATKRQLRKRDLTARELIVRERERTNARGDGAVSRESATDVA